MQITISMFFLSNYCSVYRETLKLICMWPTITFVKNFLNTSLLQIEVSSVYCEIYNIFNIHRSKLKVMYSFNMCSEDIHFRKLCNWILCCMIICYDYLIHLSATYCGITTWSHTVKGPT